MIKLLFYAGLVANVLLIVSSSGTSSTSKVKSSSSSSTASATSTSTASASATSKSSGHSSTGSDDDECDYVKPTEEPSDDCSGNKNDKKCKAHETYNECPYFSCEPRTCDQLGYPQPCPIQNVNATCPGKPACVCVNGYLRNKKGVCVPQDNCPSCGGDPNAKAGCGVNCGRLCSNYKEKNVICPLFCKLNGCDCKPNFVFDSNIGKCVEPGNCSITCTNPNEVYDPCPPGCPPQKCGFDPASIQCARYPEVGDPDCEPACRCIDDYVRNDEGVCIPRDQCPTCTKDNEEYDPCPETCPPQTCDSIGQIYNCPLQSTNKTNCQGACRCKSGYYRNSLDECVSEADCKQCTGINEYYDPCPPFCSPQTCETIGVKLYCPAHTQVCQPACRCNKGYYRNSQGTCIPEKECKECTQPNEEYVICPATCPPQTCEAIGKTIHCPLIKTKCEGQGSCRCKSGFYRNAINNCIWKENCLKCSGPNEFYSCGGACDNVCATLSQQNQTNCPIVNIKCNEMCYCKDGYARDADNICIPIKDCPSTTCPEGEIYNKCPPEKCDAENCPLSRNSPTSCKSPKNCGKPRCTCGFLEKRDRTTGQCVLAQDCPPFECDGPNEEYQSCPAGCPGEDCTDYINNSTCSKFRIGIVVPCKPQCRCKENYYRNCKNICIKASQCFEETTTTVGPTRTTKPSCVATETGQQRLVAGTNVFNLKFLKYVLSTTDDSVIMSAFSLEILLAELALYTTGDSFDQLLTLINLKSKDEIRDVFKPYLENLRSQNNVQFDIAVKTYCNNNYQLSDSFKQDTGDIFGATAENIDCNNPTQAAATMNQWVEDNTNNLIQDLVSPDMVKPDTALFLLDALYFKGTWLHQFNSNNTEDRDFYVNNNTIKQVQTMYQQNKFNYADSSKLDAKILSLPYANPNFTCYFFLPNYIEGLNDLLDKMEDANLVSGEIKSMTNETVKVWIPKSEIDTTINLVDALKETGITYIFDPSTSGLDGILTKPEKLYVSNGIQKAYVKMNEEGSEAAAANAIGVSATAVFVGPVQDLEFDANHPFLIFIREGDTTVFCGAFRK